MTLNIEDYLHPLLKHGLTKNASSAYNATIKALNKPLQDAEYDILRSKTNLLLKETSKEWLDYFGEYLGLHRKVNENDNSYRDRLLKWVLVSKNDVSSIRNAIADFLGTNADNIYVYEPYNDIFYLNYNKSLLNSMSYLPSTYYNYCVIDVKIDGSFPAKEISDIINLFRPAGVLWIVTSNINSFNTNAPIIDLELDGSILMEYDITNYCGFNDKHNLSLTPSFNDDIVVTNPFYYNDKLSLLNNTDFGGRNLLLDSKTHSSSAWIINYTDNSADNGTYLDSRIMATNRQYGGLRYDVNNLIERNVICAGETYTFSVFVKCSEDAEISDKLLRFYSNGTFKVVNTSIPTLTTDDFVRASVTVMCNTVEPVSRNSQFGIELSTALSSGTIYFAAPKFEKGASATNYSEAPEDIDVHADKAPNVNIYGKEYASFDSEFNDYMTFGLYYTEYTPKIDEDFPNARKYSKNYSALDNAKMSYYDSDYLLFDVGSYDIDTDNPIKVTLQGQQANTGQYQVLPDMPLKLVLKGSPNTSYLMKLDMESLGGVLTLTSTKGSYEFLSNQYYALTTDTNGDFEVSLSTSVGQLLISDNINAYMFNSGEQTDNHFAYNTSHYASKGIGGCADIKHFVQMYGGMSTSVTPKDILNKYPDIYLTLSSYLNQVVNQTSFTFNLELFNFALNMWVTVDSIELSKTQSQINYRIPDLTNYLNKQGLLYYRLTSPDSASCSLCLNLISLTFSSTEYNVPSLNWYYNSPELVSQNTFMNNTMGTWDGSSIIDVSNTSIPYTKALYSETGQLIDNTRFNVVPGSVYYIDTWVQSSSPVSIEIKDTQHSISLNSQDSAGWQHIVGNIVIPDDMFTCNFYVKTTDNAPLSLAYVAATLQQ